MHNVYLVLRALPVRGVGAFEHGAATRSEVCHRILVTKHDLELAGVRVIACANP